MDVDAGFRQVKELQLQVSARCSERLLVEDNDDLSLQVCCTTYEQDKSG